MSAFVFFKTSILSFIFLLQSNVPVLWELPSAQSTPVGIAIYSLLIIQALRPDRLLSCAHRLVFAVFGQGFMEAARANLDLGAVVEHEIKADTPILLCATPVNCSRMYWLEFPLIYSGSN